MQGEAQTESVFIRIEGRVGRISLNRPKALHALNLDMCRAMIDALLAWKDDPNVALVIIDHLGDRGFCAGGDIRMLAESGRTDGADAKAFFRMEYRLNHLLFAYPKPVATFMDGLTMGGGVGISEPARLRIATERTVYAMPETGIGLFPDVGGGWFLSRMPGKTGLWLALTGSRLKAADLVALGVATHYAPAESIEAFKRELVDSPEAAFGLAEVFARDPGPAPVMPRREAIDRLFSGPSVEAIFAALAADGSEFATEQLSILRTKSPQAMKVSYRQLAHGAALATFEAEMRMEYRLGGRIVMTHDFQEGVRAVIVDKDNAPRWRPERLEEVTDAMLDALFAPLEPEAEWTPLASLA